MKKYGRIENGKVVEVFDLHEHHPTLNSITGLFHPSQVWVEAPDDVAEGWPVFDGVIVAPDYYKVQRLASYPPITDLADALAKFHSANLAMQAEGTAQLAAYCSACLDVKLQFPKPT